MKKIIVPNKDTDLQYAENIAESDLEIKVSRLKHVPSKKIELDFYEVTENNDGYSIGVSLTKRQALKLSNELTKAVVKINNE